MPLNITFGIELEFVCVYPVGLFGAETGEAAGAEIYRRLNANRIPATGHEDPDDDIYDGAPSYSRWIVATDNLGLSPNEARYLPHGYRVEAIELTSRIFNSPGSSAWRNEVGAVLRVLRNIERRGCRFLTNASTGFHVHVGNGRRPIPLPAAKKVYQLATAFERIFDDIHPTDRTRIPTDLTRSYNTLPPSYFHIYGNYNSRAGESPTLFNRLADIESLSTYQQLGGLFAVNRQHYGVPPTSGHNSAYNFDNLFADPEVDRHEEHLTGTIEFRQHAGTLDYLTIVAWVKLCCSMVQFCDEVSSQKMMELCFRGPDLGFRLGDFLSAIGCSSSTRDHFLGRGPVGTLPDLPSLPTTAVSRLAALVEMNEHENEARVDDAAQLSLVQGKGRAGHYGIAANRNYNYNRGWVATALSNALRSGGVNPNTEGGHAMARSRVYRAAAQYY